jgi:hypothetical protein
MPVSLKSSVLRVARTAVPLLQMAIWASNPSMGRPIRSRCATIVAYQVAAPASKGWM